MIRGCSGRDRSFFPLRPGIVVMMLIVLLGLPSFQARAEGILDVYSLALKNDPRFIGARFSHDASKETLTQAWAMLKPTVSAEGVYTNTNQKIISSDNTVFGHGSSSFPTTEYSLSLTQPIFNKPSFANVSRARAKVKGADMEMEAARQDLIVRIAKVYLGVLAARDKGAFARRRKRPSSFIMSWSRASSKWGSPPRRTIWTRNRGGQR